MMYKLYIEQNKVINVTSSDNLPRGSFTYKLEELAFTRSGDKVSLTEKSISWILTLSTG